MESVEDHLKKLREERMAREKARIEKLRELNLKKYRNAESQPVKNASTVSLINKPKVEPTKQKFNLVKNNFHVNGTTKRPITVPLPNLKKVTQSKPDVKITEEKIKQPVKEVKPLANVTKDKMHSNSKMSKIPKDINPIKLGKSDNAKGDFKIRKPDPDIKITNADKSAQKGVNTNKIELKSARKSIVIKETKNSRMSTANSTNRESVFERLYKPKIAPKNDLNDVEKLRKDPNFLKKVIQNSGLIINKRHTLFDKKTSIEPPVRRSISAVHFKRISKSELSNCIHKWSSIGEKLDKVHLEEINEDETLKTDKVISAVKSERKKVKFQTPIPQNFNTPKPEELQARLKSWLQKRGKSLDSYHHLQCFGLHHITSKIKPLIFDEPKLVDDDENKENIALENDSDNESFVETMNYQSDLKDTMKWRRASNIRESTDLNDTVSSNNTFASAEVVHPVEELIFGALNDLTELLKEGFDWEQCARWLRAIRERYPNAPSQAAYWECRAALEERRGDLPASVQCWEEAIAKGTEHSVVEENLDHLLDKFMQLKISPNSGKRRQIDPKLVDVKNVFKSTIIRFAVQQAKLRQSSQSEPTFTVTPVRRSARLSVHWSGKRTPLQVCTTVKQASEFGRPLVFVPNETLCDTP